MIRNRSTIGRNSAGPHPAQRRLTAADVIAERYRIMCQPVGPAKVKALARCGLRWPASGTGSKTMADVKYFKGHYLVWALNAHEFRRDVGGTQLPYVRHETLGAAVRAAEKLHEQMPNTTFVVIREVARVKTICARPAVAAAPEMETANG